MGRYFGLRA